jgi:phospholipase/carboxylesterase
MRHRQDDIAPLETVEIEPRAPARAAVIWLHGLGADGHDFEPVVPDLGLPERCAARFVFPHAPRRPVTTNGGMVMRAWYDITGFDFEGGEDEDGIRASEAAVRGLIERERHRGIEPGRIVLAGFSQGGAIALQTGLRSPERLAGIISLSSYLPLAGSVAQEATASGLATPLFLAHGRQDPLIPWAAGAASRRQLEELGCTVEWHDYPMPHSVCLEELRDIGEFLGRVLGA